MIDTPMADAAAQTCMQSTSSTLPQSSTPKPLSKQSKASKPHEQLQQGVSDGQPYP